MINTLKAFKEVVVPGKELRSISVEKGCLRVDGQDIPIRDIRSINLLHEFDKDGVNGLVNVFVNKIVRRRKSAFGGSETKRVHIGRAKSDSVAANNIRGEVRDAKIPVLEM